MADSALQELSIVMHQVSPIHSFLFRRKTHFILRIFISMSLTSTCIYGHLRPLFFIRQSLKQLYKTFDGAMWPPWASCFFHIIDISCNNALSSPLLNIKQLIFILSRYNYSGIGA